MPFMAPEPSLPVEETFRDWAAVDAFMGKFMAMQMSQSPEEMKASQEKWYSLIEAGSHFDTIYRHMIFEVGEDMTPPAYFNLGYYDAKPGQNEALMGQFKKYGKPVMGKLMEAGTIKSWGVAVPEVHGGTAGSHVMWWGMDSLAARDALLAGFEAAAKERGEEAQKAAMEEWMAAVDMSGHHDRIMWVTYKGGSAAAGLVPQQLGVDAKTLRDDYVVQIALLDSGAADEAEQDRGVRPAVQGRGQLGVQNSASTHG